MPVDDSLAADPGDRFDLVLTNPPFGKKSSTTIVVDVAPAIHGSRDIRASMHVGRFRSYTYDELINRDKASLDIFWLKDESLSDSDNLPAPDVIAAEIVEDLEAALVAFREIAGDLGGEVALTAE